MNSLEKTIVLIAAAAAAAVCFYTGGYLKGRHRADAEIAALKQEYAVNAAKANAEYAAKLQAAEAERRKWYEFSQKQSVDLAAALRELDKKQADIKKEIGNAVEQDQKNNRGCVGGLGANSLRIYEHALGY